MITIIDYGLGNVLAFKSLFEGLNIPAKIARTAADFAKSTKLILPGVGAFDDAMQRFEASGMRTAAEALVLERKIPVLGVCVGMQMFASSSEEGKMPGLAWVGGTVKKFHDPLLSLPHMGWNDVALPRPSALFAEVGSQQRFYFLHSYCFECSDNEEVIGHSFYGQRFACAINRGNIFGVQFHPEKSHRCGTMLLKNFARL